MGIDPRALPWAVTERPVGAAPWPAQFAGSAKLEHAIKANLRGLWIEREIWLSPQLSLVEKVLFTEIRSLDNERGCYASNHYFAVFFSVSDRQIASRHLPPPVQQRAHGRRRLVRVHPRFTSG